MAGMQPWMDGRHDGWLRMAIWGGAGALLALPWVAMRFTREVDWDGTDFLVMGALLLLACAACELALRLSRHVAYRLGFAVAVGTGFVTVWANLAVGMVGEPGDPANLLFGGVLLLALGGAFAARLRARGMAVAMGVAAVAQAVAALLAGAWSGWEVGVALAAGFAVPWLAAAALFRCAARDAGAGTAG